MRAKETLQLRHQLTCNGLSLRAATYDTKRHHVLTFDSHPSQSHVLRLFSLRRELKSVPLFDKKDEDETKPKAVDKTSKMSPEQHGHKRSSFFELQQQQVEAEKRAQQPKVDIVVPSLTLTYSPNLDVFVCVYTSASRKLHSKIPIVTTHSVLLLEPATLRKLLLYAGPASHSLQCTHYDPWSDRLVLASHLKMEKKARIGHQEEEGDMLPSAPRNVVEILQLSKRLDDRAAVWPADAVQENLPKQRVRLCVENMHASLRHPDTLDLICASRGLRELYGAAGGVASRNAGRRSSGSLDTSRTESSLLEWRLNQSNGGKFVLVRRVMLREGVTAIAISPCGDWLLAGFCKGGLKVWNVNGSRTNASALFTVDAAPFEPTGAGIEDAQTEVISSIKITTTPTTGENGETSTEVIVIAAERDTGAVRHWKFSVERRIFGSGDELEHRYPRLDLVGYFNSGGKDKLGKRGRQNNDEEMLGTQLRTLIMCVSINMGSCFENLLLVVHEDVIHVLKIQTVLYIMQKFASIEEAFAVRTIFPSDECKVISLSSTAASRLRVFPLDENASSSELDTPGELFVPPPTLDHSHISSIETVISNNIHTSFIVLAWSCGVVDIYNVSQQNLVMRLRDNQLTDQISALSVITFQRLSRATGAPTLKELDEDAYLSSRSYADMFGDSTGDMADRSNTNVLDDTEDHTRKTVVVVVGTESGKLFSWNVEGLLGELLERQTIQEAKVRVKAAHSTHVVQFAHVGERTVLVSVAADGIIKLWKVPSMAMIGHVSSVAEGYAVTPSCIEVMEVPQTGTVESGRPQRDEFCVSAGYEDGRLAVWRVNTLRSSFQILDVSTKHERRVSKICSISKDVATAGSIEFMSCSLDMTVIQWQILESGNSVQEKRYFDIGGAIVDMILIQEQAVVAMAHEVCKFVFAPNVKRSMKYLVNLEATADVYTAQDTSTIDSEENLSSVIVPSQLTDAEDCPDTPTTRSVEETEATGITLSPHHTSRSVDEYLTLHVPSAVLHLEAASTNDFSQDTPVESTSMARKVEEELFISRDETADGLQQHKRASKSTGKLQHSSIGNAILRECLQDYIARHGTEGTMSASRLTHLLALRPELPTIKRPGFALAKTLQGLKLTAQDRVDSEEALNVLRVLFETATAFRRSFDAPTMARALKLKGYSSKQARAQKKHEKDQARRKPVVTYNILGEKYVRWEETSRKEHNEAAHNQSPRSPTNSLVVHTPPSPSMRDVMDPEEGWPSTNDDLSQEARRLTHEDIQATDRNAVVSDSPDGKHRNTSSSSESELPSNEGTDHANIAFPTRETNDSGSYDLMIKTKDYRDDTDKHGSTPPNQSSGKMMFVSSDDVQDNPSKGSDNPVDGVEKYAEARPTNRHLSESILMNNIRLSTKFQKFWTKGFCWCEPASQLHIIWVDNNKRNVHDVDNSAAKQRAPRCEVCRKRMHSIQLSHAGYTPHFSRQATFAIILEVYSKLTATAHTRLYKSSSFDKQTSPRFSLFGALFDVFLIMYGMRSTAEQKLKLFFVSMCHFIHKFDAIAVFGELLGLHMPEDAGKYDQAPNTLVALCVCCYSWIYSRGMVMNGDCFAGGVPSGDRRILSNSAAGAGEVTPAKDGINHWQFVRIEHALLCAQENLLYPLVSPGFLKNIMLSMQEYAQRAPNQPQSMDAFDLDDEHGDSVKGVWIEMHRFLRLLVAEWKQQNIQFRVAERLLFVHPLRDAAFEGDLVEKLRLMLSCFIFYDHERAGAMTTSDFETLLLKLQYLWPEKDAMAQKSVFENVILATRKRFIDVNHDGELCYLDFWAMLYIVGVKTRSLIQLHEIPSFCRDYRLEISPELVDILWSYMQLSCTLLLPKGLQLGKSSLDQKAEHQHRRRVGGLHDGMFHIRKTLKNSLSIQELLSTDNTQRRELFLDGTAPATRQSASVAALDRFRPVSVETEFDSNSLNGSDCRLRREPVVMGIRSIGPTPKKFASLRVSELGNSSLSSEQNDKVCLVDTQTRGRAKQIRRSPRIRPTDGEFTNMYIQFPQVPPMRRRIGPGIPIEAKQSLAREIIGYISSEEDDDDNSWEGSIASGQKEDEGEELEMPSAAEESLTRASSTKSLMSLAPEQPYKEEADHVDQPRPLSYQPSILNRRRSTTAVVVVPTVETEAFASRKVSRSGMLSRQPSRGLQRAVSTRVTLEETAALLNADAFSPTPVVPVTTSRGETTPDSESEDSQSHGSDEGGFGDDNDDEEKFYDKDDGFPQTEVGQVIVEMPTEPENAVNGHFVQEDPVVSIPSVDEANDLEATPIIEDTAEPLPVVAERTGNTLVDEEYTPFDELVPAEELVADSNAKAKEEVETTNKQQSLPRIVKEKNIQVHHHAFRFSQQPAFIRSVEVTNNPYRSAMWNPKDDSESDDEEENAGKKKRSSKGDTNGWTAQEMNDDAYSSKEEYSAESGRGGNANGGEKHSSSHPKTDHSDFMPASHFDSSTASLLSKVPATTSPLKRKPSNFSGNHDNSLLSLQRTKRSSTIDSREHHYSEGLESIQDYVDDVQVSVPLKTTAGCMRLDEDAERALYGERLLNVLGDGIAFSPEAEVAMQQKWHQFFVDSESKMFSTLRHELEKKQTEQQDAEERQKKLRKKWQVQRDQDLLRLQQSRQNTILLSATATNSTSGAAEDASFRLRRIHRESCRDLSEELQYGVSFQRECKKAKDTRFFHFYYSPEGHGSIITLKMHVTHGDAAVFMSTETKVPCGTDFMWKSSEKVARGPGGPNEGHRIILYPHDLLRLVTAASTNAATNKKTAAIVECNTSTASLRSFYQSKQPDATTFRVGFYLSVVALEPGTMFSLSVMTSGQKMQPSKAIQTVDYLIDRFNMLSKSFKGHSPVPVVTPSANSNSRVPTMSNITTGRRVFEDRQQITSDEIESETVDENESTTDADTVNVESSAKSERRKTKKENAETANSNELKSFQHLLETLSEKKGYGSPRVATLLLAGPSEEHLEFVEDENQRLQELHQQLSPTKDSGEMLASPPRDFESVMTERRLTMQGKRQKLRRVVAARLKQRLKPLHRKSTSGVELEKSASTDTLASIRVAKAAPKPVAYSITTLDPLPRRHLTKSATVALLPARSTTVVDKQQTEEAEANPLPEN